MHYCCLNLSDDGRVGKHHYHFRPNVWASVHSDVVNTRYYSTQQAESTEEEPLHSIISDTENVQGVKANAA